MTRSVLIGAAASAAFLLAGVYGATGAIASDGPSAGPNVRVITP